MHFTNWPDASKSANFGIILSPFYDLSQVRGFGRFPQLVNCRAAFLHMFDMCSTKLSVASIVIYIIKHLG